MGAERLSKVVNLVYHSSNVGPVCQRVVAAAPDKLRACCDKKDLPKGTILRWGSTVVLDAAKEINSAASVILAKDKGASREALSDLAPETWFTQREISLPCVIRPMNHHAAKKFFVCHDTRSMDKAIRLCGTGWYASALVEKAREWRVFVLHNHVVAVSERFPANPSDIAWNLAVGGRLINSRKEEWRPQDLLVALEAAKRLGLDWAAIDLAVDKSDTPYVFEANTAPGLRNPYTISRIAKGLRWSDTHPVPERTGDKTWKHLIHPALLRKSR